MDWFWLVLGVLSYAVLLGAILMFLRGASLSSAYDRDDVPLTPAVHEALVVALTTLDRVEPQIRGDIPQTMVDDAIRTLRAVLNRPDPGRASMKEE